MEVSFSDSRSRKRPPAVPPIKHDGVRYEPLPAASGGSLPPGRYVIATNIISGQCLWTAKLFDLVTDPALEADVQAVFLRSIKLASKREALAIEDERGRKFRVYLSDGRVEAL